MQKNIKMMFVRIRNTLKDKRAQIGWHKRNPATCPEYSLWVQLKFFLFASKSTYNWWLILVSDLRMADSQQQPRERGWLVFKHHVLTHKIGKDDVELVRCLIWQRPWGANLRLPSHSKKQSVTYISDLALWATRLATIVFTVGYILPVFDNPYNSYYKVRPESKCKFRNVIDAEKEINELLIPRLWWQTQPPQLFVSTKDYHRFVFNRFSPEQQIIPNHLKHFVQVFLPLQVQLSRQFLYQFLLEDSAHYLFFR